PFLPRRACLEVSRGGPGHAVRLERGKRVRRERRADGQSSPYHSATAQSTSIRSWCSVGAAHEVSGAWLPLTSCAAPTLHYDLQFAEGLLLSACGFMGTVLAAAPSGSSIGRTTL